MLERITFLDCNTHNAWIPVSEANEHQCVRVVAEGRVIYEDNEQVSLALLMDEDKEVMACVAAIPKGAVIKREQVGD